MSAVPHRRVRRFNHSPQQSDSMSPHEWPLLFSLVHLNSWSPYPSFYSSLDWRDLTVRPTPHHAALLVDGFCCGLSVYLVHEVCEFKFFWNDRALNRTQGLIRGESVHFVLVPFEISGELNISVINSSTSAKPKFLSFFDLSSPLVKSSVRLEFSTPYDTATSLVRLVSHRLLAVQQISSTSFCCCLS
jgi:hypothetical protein